VLAQGCLAGADGEDEWEGKRDDTPPLPKIFRFRSWG
jgi:hypothetical protein